MRFLNLNTILLGKQFIGLELFSVEAEDWIAYVKVEKKSNELVITQKGKKTKFEQLVDKPNNSQPVFIVINNSLIIQKEVESVELLDSKIVYKAFPNIKTEEFYFEIWRLETKSIVTICRKKQLEDIVEKYSSLGFTVAGISLGINSLASIKNYITDSSIKTNTQTISFDTDSDLVITANENTLIKNYDVNELEIQSTYLLSFSNVLQNIINTQQTSGNIHDYNRSLFEDFKQNSFFKKGIQLVVVSLLSILLVNFFIFSHYFKKSNVATSTIEANKNTIVEINKIKQQLKSKENTLKNSTSLFNSKSSYLINELIKDIPSSILLDELTFCPIEKKTKENEPILTQENIVVLSGKTSSDNAFTNWIDAIDRNNWVKKTTILNFGKNEQNQTTFSIKINFEANEVK